MALRALRGQESGRAVVCVSWSLTGKVMKPIVFVRESPGLNTAKVAQASRHFASPSSFRSWVQQVTRGTCPRLEPPQLCPTPERLWKAVWYLDVCKTEDGCVWALIEHFTVRLPPNMHLAADASCKPHSDLLHKPEAWIQTAARQQMSWPWLL